MEWIQLLTVVGANLAMFMWARSEAREDQAEMRMILKAIQDEMKDFHGRLCSIEEKNKEKRQ
jgi:hypothetical protein